MIFSDKQTAAEVRQEAEKQLANWIGNMFITVRDVAGKTFVELSDNALHSHAQDQIRTMPPLVATLLFRSGMIHPSNENEGERPHYPVVLYYDQDYDYELSHAMHKNKDRLVGGMIDGRINT